MSLPFAPIDRFTDAQQRATDAQLPVGGEFGGHVGADSALRVVNLGAAPAVMLRVVGESGEEHDAVGGHVPLAFVWVVDILQLVALRVAVMFQPDDLAAVGAVGKFDNLGAETVAPLLAGVCADNIVSVVVQAVLRHSLAKAQHQGNRNKEKTFFNHKMLIIRYSSHNAFFPELLPASHNKTKQDALEKKIECHGRFSFVNSDTGSQFS